MVWSCHLTSADLSAFPLGLAVSTCTKKAVFCWFDKSWTRRPCRVKWVRSRRQPVDYLRFSTTNSRCWVRLLDDFVLGHRPTNTHHLLASQWANNTVWTPRRRHLWLIAWRFTAALWQWQQWWRRRFLHLPGNQFVWKRSTSDLLIQHHRWGWSRLQLSLLEAVSMAAKASLHRLCTPPSLPALQLTYNRCNSPLHRASTASFVVHVSPAAHPTGTPQPLAYRTAAVLG